MWIFAHRSTSILGIQWHHIRALTATEVAVQIHEGKTMAYFSPYTVFSAPGIFGPLLQRMLSPLHRVTQSGYLFPRGQRRGDPTERSFQGQCLQLLRRANPQLDLRSLRRGSLTHMAQMGVPDETLLLFSRHATVQMLHTYLDWGLHNQVNRSRMLAASGHLTPCSPVETGGTQA